MADQNAIIFLQQYLYDHTDDNHPITAAELETILRQAGYASDRRTIRKNIERLRDLGHDILIEERKGVATSYYYGARDWDMTELRILIDAVSSAQFITNSRSQEIIEKLSLLAGRQNKELLVPDVFVSEHIKAVNNQILYTLERVSTAIREKKKIAFRYYNYNIKKERIFRHNGEVYILSPYATVWNDDRYYVVGYSDKRDTIVSFRIDRMPTPEMLDENAVPVPKDFHIQDYTDKFTKMYGGSECEVTLCCSRDLIDNIIDKFGPDVQISNVTANTFDVTVKVCVGGTFLAWMFEFAGQITVKSPECVRNMYGKMLESARTDLDAGMVSGSGIKSWKL